MRRCLFCLCLCMALAADPSKAASVRGTAATPTKKPMPSRMSMKIESAWPVARTNVVPPPGSRLFDPYDPDYPPLPPDDPAANYFMRTPTASTSAHLPP